VASHQQHGKETAGENVERQEEAGTTPGQFRWISEVKQDWTGRTFSKGFAISRTRSP
jgi:hypothetical protein